MSVTIKTISDTQVQVNGKTVFKDMNGKWVASSELSENEKKILQQHLRSIERL